MQSVLNPEAPEFFPYLTSTVQDGYQQMNKTVRASNQFPIGTSYELFKTFTDFGTVTWKIRENVVLQSNQIMVKEIPSVKLKCQADDESNTEKIIDANDSFLDRININIDTLSGVNQPSEAFLRGVQPAAWNRNPVIATIQVNGGSATLISAKNIPRPQLSFKDPVDNSDKLFMPRIRDKPNNIKPLALTILYNDEGQPIGYEHPYQTELELYAPPERVIEAGEPPAGPLELAETPLTLVQTEAELDQLVTHLDTVDELAVDLENHSYRTYQGITCLIQISTDEGGDFIVDALAVREHLHKLNQPFTDPKKIKVFHGADMDVKWLQRDFGVYLVGLFDTHQAARLLKLGGFSLKYLLQKYCRVEADKTYQLADWRMRPLPEALVRYARSDTHYLLYIWRCMKRELLEADATPPRLLLTAFENSKIICGITYNKPVIDDESHMTLYLRSQKQFTTAQMAALRMIYRWRDEQARALDESTGYLLPNHMLLALAERLPREVQGLHAVCNPAPPFVRQHADTLHRMILACRELADEPRLARTQPIARTANPVHSRRLHVDFSYLPDETSEEQIQLDAGWQALSVDSEVEADVRVVDEATPPRPWETQPNVPQELKYLACGEESQLNADAPMFLPPYDRYRMCRAVFQAKELKDLREKEARVAAISRGNELIRQEVLVPLQRGHEDESGMAPPTGEAPLGKPNGDATLDRAKGAAPIEITPATDTANEHKRNSSERKRKISDKQTQIEVADQPAENKTDSHKNTKREDAVTVKSFVYKNVNYKKFYSNDQGHKQTRTKSTKS